MLARSIFGAQRVLNVISTRSATMSSNATVGVKLKKMLQQKTTAAAMKAPKLASPTSAVTRNPNATNAVHYEPIAQPAATGQWGIQMVLAYIKTQKVSKCVVFDTYSQIVENNYAIVCTVPSSRAMASLADRLAQQARMHRPLHYEKFAAGHDPDGLWSVADLGTIAVHILTEAGRGSPSFQRVERRLLNDAELVPVSRWGDLKDAWVEREDRLVEDPPTPFPYTHIQPPPGYYTRPQRRPVEAKVRIEDESEDEFQFYELDEAHKMQTIAADTGDTSLAGAWRADSVEFVEVQTEYDGSRTYSHAKTVSTGATKPAKGMNSASGVPAGSGSMAPTGSSSSFHTTAVAYSGLYDDLDGEDVDDITNPDAHSWVADAAEVDEDADTAEVDEDADVDDDSGLNSDLASRMMNRVDEADSEHARVVDELLRAHKIELDKE